MREIIGSSSLKNLLVLIDESHDSERALPVAIRFAERMGAPVELLSVADATRSTALHEHTVDVAHQAGHPVEGVAVIEGDDVPFEVGRRARSRAGSAIVMSGDGPRRSSGVLTHSLTAELVADGLAVVVVGPEAIAHASDLPVVACLDGSEDAEQVLPFAASWAAALDVPLDLVVVARPRLVQVPDTVTGQDSAEQDAAESGHVLRRAAHVVASARPGLDVRLHIATYPWDIADALATYLRRHPAQLLAVATHVRSGWGRLIAPSTTVRLVRRLATPMLIVPIGAAATATADEPVETHTATTPAPSRLPTEVASDTSCFDEIIVPIGPDEVLTDAVDATVNSLAAATGATVRFVTCEPAVGSADVADTILAAVDESPRSIVCMATHAPGRIVDTLAPTVSGRIVRWSSRPVVLVGPECAPPPPVAAEVVACVDGSLISEAVADVAGSWARAFGTSVRILETFDPATIVEGSPTLAGRYVDRLAARIARSHDVAARGTAVSGANTSREIRAWSDAHPGTLLVMASHGAGLSEQQLGGVVMDVVRHVHAPVVVVPAHSASRSHTAQTSTRPQGGSMP